MSRSSQSRYRALLIYYREENVLPCRIQGYLFTQNTKHMVCGVLEIYSKLLYSKEACMPSSHNLTRFLFLRASWLYG